jgi:TrmH family RNA methyltransferase
MHILALVATLCCCMFRRALSFSSVSSFSTLSHSLPWHKRPVITSAANEQIKSIKKLTKGKGMGGERSGRQSVVVEGHRAVIDAINIAKLTPKVLYVCNSAFHAPLGDILLQTLRNSAVGDAVVVVHDSLMPSLSATETTQGVIALFDRPTPIRAFKHGTSHVLILDQISDPGNMGTLIRTAHTLGWDAVITARGKKGGSDPFSAKCVRASMGACLYIPVIDLHWDDVPSLLSLPLPLPLPLPLSVDETETETETGTNKYKKGKYAINCHASPLPIYVAEASATAIPYYETDLASRACIIIGSEATGISQECRSALSSSGSSGVSVSIPMEGSFDSLNAAAVGAIMMAETTRQRVGSKGSKI